jgi:hypothetical protein
LKEISYNPPMPNYKCEGIHFKARASPMAPSVILPRKNTPAFEFLLLSWHGINSTAV